MITHVNIIAGRGGASSRVKGWTTPVSVYGGVVEDEYEEEDAPHLSKVATHSL